MTHDAKNSQSLDVDVCLYRNGNDMGQEQDVGYPLRTDEGLPWAFSPHSPSVGSDWLHKSSANDFFFDDYFSDINPDACCCPFT